MSLRMTSAREPAVLFALLGAELEQDDDEPEVAQQVPAGSRAGELVCHRDRERDPRLVENQEVQHADRLRRLRGR